MNRMQVLGLTAGVLLAPAVAASDAYFFIPGSPDARYDLTTGLASGSRDAGAFGRHGSEAFARLRSRLGEGWTLEGNAALADNGIDDRHERSYSVEARYALADSGVTLGAGYRNDYTQVSVPYARLQWSGYVGGAPVAAGAVVEVPQADDRDDADLLLATAWGLPCRGAWRCAIELAGEDLEGFVDAEEAEGGAKFILGPTLSWRWTADRWLQLHAGWIHAATANEPSRSGFADYRGHRDGAMLRLALGFGR